jgi:hypothetical protein
MGGHRRQLSEGRCAERRTEEIRRRELTVKQGWKPNTGEKHEVRTSQPAPQTGSSGTLPPAA